MKRPLRNPTADKGMARPDRVCTLDVDGKPLEVHSVPIGNHPLEYARHLHQRSQSGRQSIAAFLIETRDKKRIVSASQIVG
jgi:hypothetical protein